MAVRAGRRKCMRMLWGDKRDFCGTRAHDGFHGCFQLDLNICVVEEVGVSTCSS